MKKITMLFFGSLATTLMWTSIYAQQYCEPSAGTFNVEPITSVVFENLNNTTSATIDGTPGFEDFTAMTANVVAGSSHTITLKGNTNGSYTNLFTVFIDWNQNGILDDAGEIYQIPGSIVSSVGTDDKFVSGPIAVPSNALVGDTRMRIIKNFSSYPTNPCGSYSFGQAEDYTVNVSIPDCPSPFGMTLVAATTTTANLSWTAGDSESEWEVLWGPAGFDTDTEGTPETISTTPEISLSGLTQNTEYDIYVTAICGVGDESSVNGPTSFTTSCGNATIPYVMNFESATAPNLPDCTSGENTGIGNDWKTKSSTTTGFVGKVLNYSYHLASNPGNANSWFYTQGVELEAGVVYEISYRYGNNSTAYTESMKVAYGTSPSEASMTNLIADHPIIKVSTPEDANFFFTAATDDVYYFGFNVYSIENQNQLYLDDITIDLAPTCPAPGDLAVSNITEDSVDVSWTESGAATEWSVIYGPTGFDPLTEGDTVAVSNDAELSLTGLDNSTAYDVYVLAVCGTNDESLLTGPLTFRTLCAPGTVPFYEGFEGGYTDQSTLTGCWTQAVSGMSWTTNSSLTQYNRTPRTGDFNVTLRYGSETWMFYMLDLTVGNEYELKFYARQDATTGASIEAAFGTTDTSAGMTNSIITTSAVTSGDYQEFSGVFTPETSGLYYIGIKATLSFTPWYISLDDISVTSEPLSVNDNNILADTRLFPNPLNDNTFYINAPKLNGERVEVNIVDMAGRQIFNNTLDCNDNKVTVSVNNSLTSGMYLVTLKHGSDIHTYKLVKE